MYCIIPNVFCSFIEKINVATIGHIYHCCYLRNCAKMHERLFSGEESGIFMQSSKSLKLTVTRFDVAVVVVVVVVVVVASRVTMGDETSLKVLSKELPSVILRK